jgi:5'-nucleotidase / UDP-sugar diphosphatase
MSSRNITRRGFLTGLGTVLASATVSLASGPVAAFAEDASGDKIVLVHTNDVHCCFSNDNTSWGYAQLKDYVRDQRSTYGSGNVSLIDAGDFLQGEPVGILSNGSYPAQVVNACDYDVMTLGNHEFEYGVYTLIALANTYSLPIVCCNFTDAFGNPLFNRYKTIKYTVGGKEVSIAYVGVVTPSTLGSYRPSFFCDDDGNYLYDFCQDDGKSSDALVSAVQSAVDDARKAGADYVVLLSHLGQTLCPDQWRSDTIVEKTRGIDIVIDGHSHEIYVKHAKNLDGDEVPITQTGNRFTIVGRITIDPATGEAGVEVGSINAGMVQEWSGKDEGVAVIADGLTEKTDEALATSIGTLDVKLAKFQSWNGSTPPDTVGTNFGDLACDAMLQYSLKAGKSVDVAITYAGSPAIDVAVGEITLRDVYKAFTYANELEYMQVKGQHILDMLEIMVSWMPEYTSGFPCVSKGFEVVYRYDIPTPVKRSGGTNVTSIEGARRVVSAKLNGTEIDPDATYGLLTISYLLYGSGYGIPSVENPKDAVSCGKDIDAVTWYIQTYLDGHVGEGYENACGSSRVRLWSADDDTPGGGDDDTPSGDDDTPGGGDDDTPSGDDDDAPGGGTDQDSSDSASGEKSGADARGGGSVPDTSDTADNVAAVVTLGAAAVLAGGACAAASVAEGQEL